MLLNNSFFKSLFLASICFLILSVSVISNETNGSIIIIKEIPKNYSIISILSFCFVFYIFLKNIKVPKQIFLISTLITIIILIGESFYYFNSFQGITNGIKTFLIFLGKIFASSYLLSCIMTIIIDKLKENTKFVLEDNYSFMKIMVLILTFWLPFLIIFFPGTPTWDGLTMLNSGYGLWHPNDHHPFLLSVFFAKVISLRKYIGDFYAFGMLTIILFTFQLLNYSLSCYILCKINKQKSFPGIFHPYL